MVLKGFLELQPGILSGLRTFVGLFRLLYIWVLKGVPQLGGTHGYHGTAILRH